MQENRITISKLEIEKAKNALEEAIAPPIKDCQKDEGREEIY